MARTPQRPVRRGATQTAAPTRLPSTRERKPALAALGVLLILGGALASGYLALQAGNREQFLVVTNEMVQGDEFTDDDLDEVDLPEGMSGVVPADQRDDVVGTSASVPLLPGTILTPTMYSTAEGGRPGYVTLTLEVPSTDAAAQETSGAPLVVLLTGDDQANDLPVPVELVSVIRPDDEGPGSSDTVALNVSVESGPCATAVGQASYDDAFQVATGVAEDAEVRDCDAAAPAPTQAPPADEEGP